jgi:hypothetical protein
MGVKQTGLLGSASQRQRPCPQPCPELSKSDPTQPHLDEQKHAQTGTKGPANGALQNRQAAAAPSLEGSIPSPLRGSRR